MQLTPDSFVLGYRSNVRPAENASGEGGQASGDDLRPLLTQYWPTSNGIVLDPRTPRFSLFSLV